MLYIMLSLALSSAWRYRGKWAVFHVHSCTQLKFPVNQIIVVDCERVVSVYHIWYRYSTYYQYG